MEMIWDYIYKRINVDSKEVSSYFNFNLAFLVFCFID